MVSYPWTAARGQQMDSLARAARFYVWGTFTGGKCMIRSWRDNIEIDEEMDLADEAIRRSFDREDALNVLGMFHRNAFEQAMRDKDEARLSEVAEWMGRAEFCLDEMAELRRVAMQWSWEKQATEYESASPRFRK